MQEVWKINIVNYINKCLIFFNCFKVETECVIKVNEGESRGRRRSQVNYAEPNLRRFIYIQIKKNLLLIPI
jgi:hypothetical protein